ncbi:MAG: DEAD/DEAH box helicase, partial [Treponema sp.]|nr:DEAD/DEAH box helicase [Treponema sp.]
MIPPIPFGKPQGAPYLDIVFDIPLDRVFSYRGDPAGEAAPGRRVMAPFGRRESLGYVIGERFELPEGVSEDSLKAVRRVVDREPVFDEDDVELARWMAGYYFCGIGEALAAMIPSGRRTGAPSVPGFTEDTDAIAGTPLELSAEQEAALRAITATEPAGKPAAGGDRDPPFYLYGITGSGKTEVFLRAAESVLGAGRSVIYLVPEISLTHQTAEAIGRRFGRTASTFHSGMSPSARLAEWMRIRRGEARIVVGPRSAVFAPLRELGLIIIDE